MEHDRSDDETQSSSKKLKLNEEEEGNIQDQIAVANAADGAEEQNIADVNVVSPPGILKLDIDCCEELFAFLPLEDLHSLGQTCKRMHQFTGYFVRENYKSTEFKWRNGNLWYRSEMNGFIEFISNLLIVCSELKRFKEFAPRFKSVRKLHLIFHGDQFDCIKEILHQCEEIEISYGDNMLTVDLYEKILKFSTNLKKFSLNSFRQRNVLENNNWLLHKYPNLEYLNLYSELSTESSVAEIRTFFTLNKEIRKFQTNFWILWNCRHWIMNTDIKLDELSFKCTNSMRLNREHINLLNTLYERGFYKHLSIHQVMLIDSSVLAEIRAPLTMELSICISPLPPLNLKEFKFLSNNLSGGIETVLANNFSTIERINFNILNTERVLFFVRKCKQLEEMKIVCLNDLKPLNLVQLNEERKKVVGAKSVTIYLNERDYNAQIKTPGLELIKIKRIN